MEFLSRSESPLKTKLHSEARGRLSREMEVTDKAQMNALGAPSVARPGALFVFC